MIHDHVRMTNSVASPFSRHGRTARDFLRSEPELPGLEGFGCSGPGTARKSVRGQPSTNSHGAGGFTTSTVPTPKVKDPCHFQQAARPERARVAAGCEDFDHFGEVVEDVRRIIEGVFARWEKGINILFHGHSGGRARRRSPPCSPACVTRMLSSQAGRTRTPDRKSVV